MNQGVFGDEVKSVPVTEGDSVTLHGNITGIQNVRFIDWRFGQDKTLIARINRAVKNSDDVPDGRFRDRLQVDHQTGSLTITNISTQHTGPYQMIISGTTGTSHTFNLTVYTRLPVPVIITYCPQNPPSSSSSSSCVLLCSVLNVSHVTLSWYNGSDLHSSISVSDLNIRLSLPLEVEYQDTNTYSCVLNHQNRNQTQHLNITHDCQTCSDCVCCCYGLEAVMRLVVSVLVGVAAVAVLVYDIRSRRVEQKRSQTSSDHQ